MKIYIIGKTESFALYDMMILPGKAGGSRFESRILDEVIDGQHVIEFAGRLCYESWDLPNENTATNDKYIRNIVKQGHESVLEHVSVTFYVEGVSRNLSHELIRHRHLSFSELSQRFVDMSDANFVTPPLTRGSSTMDGVVETLCPLSEYQGGAEEGDILDGYEDFIRLAPRTYGDATRKQVREAARYYLPAGMETKFVVTGNLRAWRDVLKKRDSEHADAEMQLFAKEVKRQLFGEYPDVFADLNGESE